METLDYLGPSSSASKTLSPTRDEIYRLGPAAKTAETISAPQNVTDVDGMEPRFNMN